MKTKIFFLLTLFFFLSTNGVTGQSNRNKGKTLKQKAHEKKLKKEDFITTNNKHFLVSIYPKEDKSFINRTHHWFLDLEDTEGNPLNYANIKLKGYLKANPEMKFSYLEPVFSLCNEGKYVIGFVRVAESGPWVLEAEVVSQDIKDTFRYEIMVAEKK